MSQTWIGLFRKEDQGSDTGGAVGIKRVAHHEPTSKGVNDCATARMPDASCTHKDGRANHSRATMQGVRTTHPPHTVPTCSTLGVRNIFSFGICCSNSPHQSDNAFDRPFFKGSDSPKRICAFATYAGELSTSIHFELRQKSDKIAGAKKQNRIPHRHQALATHDTHA